jgi:hypothetical protein
MACETPERVDTGPRLCARPWDDGNRCAWRYCMEGRDFGAAGAPEKRSASWTRTPSAQLLPDFGSLFQRTACWCKGISLFVRFLNRGSCPCSFLPGFSPFFGYVFLTGGADPSGIGNRPGAHFRCLTPNVAVLGVARNTD